jgi:hypothetical protein
LVERWPGLDAVRRIQSPGARPEPGGGDASGFFVGSAPPARCSMRQDDKETTMDAIAEGDEEHRLPCAEAILAGTLGLMTAHAQADCNDQRQRIAEKVELNLAGLAEHPALSLHFRQALSALTAHWQLLEQQDMAMCEPEEQSCLQGASSWVH